MCYGTGKVKGGAAKVVEKGGAPVPARRGALGLGLLALAVIALMFSGAGRGQAPAATSAPNDPSPTATALWDWPTPDARPLQIDRGATGLWQTLLKLRTRASLLLLPAHPAHA